MESQKTNNLRTDDKKKTVKKRLYVFVFCFIISSFIWLIIQLSKEYSDVQTYSIVFSNIPSDKVLINTEDSTLTLSLKTKGFRLLSNSMYSVPGSVSIDVTTMHHKKKKSENECFILASEISHSIGEQIHLQNHIVSISPDTIFFYLIDEYTKKVPVKAMLNVTCAQQYGLTDTLLIVPDSVLVCGPRDVIDTMTFAATIPKVLSNVSTNQAFTLKFPDNRKKLITLKPEYVSVFIPVEKFTEAEIEVPVEISGSLRAKTFPEKITLSYLVPLSKYKKVNAGMFTVSADIQKAKSAGQKKVKLEVTKQPVFVKVIKIDPEKSEYILLK
jgi:hypothetical protein